jgi:hypothetical protein
MRSSALMTVANPRVSSFVGVPKGLDGRLDGPRLQAAIRYGFMIVRRHVDQPQTTGPQSTRS